MPANDNLTPRERLARIVAEETDDGRRVVRFLVQVAEGELQDDDFKGCHRMDAAKELVKIGLTEFSDYIHANSAPRKPRAASAARPDTDLSPETREAREQLAAYARELTQDGRTVIKLYAEIMDGLKNDEGFKPHHRIAAARELIKRGFDHDSARPAPVAEDQEPTDDDSEYVDDRISEENWNEIMKILKHYSDKVTPEERAAHEAEMRGVDLSMWETIRKQPKPRMTKEHARIGAAKFREAMERQRLWEESDVQLPDPKDYPKYDDP